MARNPYARFLTNNYNDPSVATITYSSQYSSTYAAANTYNAERSKIWKPSGKFVVTASNQQIYFNDGSDQTAVLVPGEYTGASLASHIQTKLNAASSNWTAAYSSTTYKFTIIRTSGTGIFRYSSTSLSAWDLLGYTRTSNDSSANFVSDEPRVHSLEYYQIDLGLAQALNAFCAIGPIDEPFCLSSTATVKVKADNVDTAANWESPIFSQTVTPTDGGIFAFFDDSDGTSNTYRYWRFEFSDPQNAGGPSNFKFSHFYFGDWDSLSISNVATGFELNRIDQTQVQYSESGAPFFRTLPKFRMFNGCSIESMDPDERRTWQRMFQAIGVGNPFYLALDPTLAVSEVGEELCAFGYFEDSPVLQHVIRDLYTVNFKFREAP